MKPVININFAKAANKEELRSKIESEVSNHTEDGVKYDKDTGIITVPDGDIKTVQGIWEIMGFKYPLEFMLARNSKGMEEAKKIYDSLCTYDRKYVQVLSSRTGCRINIHISPYRRDLLRKFLAAIYKGENYNQDWDGSF